jgi:hypothetical protein
MKKYYILDKRNGNNLGWSRDVMTANVIATRLNSESKDRQKHYIVVLEPRSLLNGKEDNQGHSLP